MPTGSGKSKESVYITVEALGVQQASESVRSVVAPLQQLTKGISALPKADKNLNNFTNQVQKSITSTDKLKSNLLALSPATRTMSSNFSDLAKSSSKGLDTFGKLIGGSSGIGKAKGMLEGLSVATGGLSTGMLAAGAAVGGVALAIGGTIKVSTELIDAYKEINPEARTYKDIMAETSQTVGDTKTAIMAIAGEALNDTLNPALETTTRLFTDATREATKFLATLMSKSKTTGESGFTSVVKGTMNEIAMSVAELVGADTTQLKAYGDYLAGGYYEARQEGEKKLAENIKKLQDQRKEKAQKDARDVAKTIKNEFADVAKELSVYSLDLASGQIWKNDLLRSRDDLNNKHSSQMSAIEGLSGDDNVKNELRIKLEEEYQNQLKDLKLRNAEETGNQEYIIAQRYIDMERQITDTARQQKLEADIAASDEKWQHELDRYNEHKRIEEEGQQEMQAYLDDVTKTVRGNLTDAFMSMFDMISGDVQDIRGHLFDMFNSMAKNLFRTSLDAIINSVVKMSMESGASAAQVPVIGPALAIAAVSGTLALGMAIAKRNQKKQPQIQYATGGYISDGLVRGAGGSGDSVEALLQPGERVLSKKETEAYDKGMSGNQIINLNVTIQSADLTNPSQVDNMVRQQLFPSFKRALAQGYKLTPA